MQPQFGMSLLELTLVVAILSVLAMIVIPQFSSTNPAKLNLAAEIQAEAMRFARTEAMRRGQPIGFRQQDNQKRMRVYSLDTGTAPWTPVYDIYHPISKQLWDVSLDTHPFAAADEVNKNTVFQGPCNSSAFIYFDNRGTARCTDPETTLLERYDVTLSLDNHSRTVTLEGLSGTVFIQ